MLVKVVPIRPISGILPNNQWLCTRSELDLNKKEVIRCMQFGYVYDQNDNLIDEEYLHKLFSEENKPVMVVNEPVEIKEEVVIMEPITIEEQPKEIVKEENYEIKLLSLEKEDDYYILETEFLGNVEGNLYGLFTNISGSRPQSLEFKDGDSWIKFSSKFKNYDRITNGEKFVFRFLPKNKNVTQYRISIKEANNVLTKLDVEVNPNE